jgi:predicted nucleic acid-binding protein
MKDKAFIDTNIFIYLYSSDEPEKREKCLQIFENYYCITSIQVLNEISNVLIKKFKIDSERIALVHQEIEKNCPVVLFNTTTIYKALEIWKVYGYSYYDSLIIATALENECEILLTEDMQSGQIIAEKLMLLNIFES